MPRFRHPPDTAICSAPADFDSYRDAQAAVDRAWLNQDGWRRMSVLTMARSGFFSSDRAIRSTAESIWNVQAAPVQMSCRVPATATVVAP